MDNLTRVSEFDLPPAKRVFILDENPGPDPAMGYFNAFYDRASEYVSRYGRAVSSAVSAAAEMKRQNDEDVLNVVYSGERWRSENAARKRAEETAIARHREEVEAKAKKSAEVAAYFDAHLAQERSRRIQTSVSRLERYLLWPLRDRTGEYDLTRLATPWVYYPDVSVYHVLKALFPVLGSGMTIKGALDFFSLAAVNPLSAGISLLTSAGEAVQSLLETKKYKIPQELFNILDVKSQNVYTGNLRWNLPGLTAAAEPYKFSEIRNLAPVHYPPLGTPRGMNTVWTFQRVRSC